MKLRVITEDWPQHRGGKSAFAPQGEGFLAGVDREDRIKSLSKVVRKVAYYKSRGEDREVAFDSGLTHRFTPDDEDDLYQIGMLALSKLSQDQLDKYSRQTLKLTASQAMNRGGTQDIRVVGNMPLAGSISNDGGPESQSHDLETVQGKDPDPRHRNDRDLMLKAIDIADVSDRAKAYLRMTANGHGPKKIGQVFRVTKNAIFGSIKRSIPKVQQALATLESNQSRSGAIDNHAYQDKPLLSHRSTGMLNTPLSYTAPQKLRHIS